MWKDLPNDQRNEYKKLILTFASLSEVFAQKAEDDNSIITPIVNSKFQETVFQKSFNASAEDIGNTSYDVAIDSTELNNTKYLVGIKTFGITSGAQKIAQFKANHDEWADIINHIKNNSFNSDGTKKTQAEINKINESLYLELAIKISTLRNKRICSSQENIKGFDTKKNKDNIESVYHVLMPSKKENKPVIYVGETLYDLIRIDNITIEGCTSKNNPTNFTFFDGNHRYRFTSADSQLLMDFKNNDIIVDQWNVKYADDAYAIFSDIADKIYGKQKEIISPKVIESYSWHIEVHPFSGFNSFFGVGSKMAKSQREKKINIIKEKYKNTVDKVTFNEIMKLLTDYLLTNASTSFEKQKKVEVRNSILSELKNTYNDNFKEELLKIIYRPLNEMYIPIPNAKEFHLKHPDFFGKDIGTFKQNSNSLALSPVKREFNLIFEPSGDCIKSYITQDNGKAIESTEKQSYLGEWILRGIFQLKNFEPLTEEKLDDIGINGIRLYKVNNSDDIHLEFIWIEDDKLPKDLIKIKK